MTGTEKQIMIVKGSLNYTTSGRKKKNLKTKKRKQDDRSYIGITRNNSHRSNNIISHRSNTVFNGQKLPPEWESERRDISSNYTIAPAYNKGAYQVIGKNEVEDIGR